MEKGKIYLIPTLLAPDTQKKVMPLLNEDVLQNTHLYFVENIRSARRFISSLHLGIEITALEFVELHQDTKAENLEEGIQKILEGSDAGIISEAGCPGIADPGALLVSLAHQLEIQVIPLVGASSILMALMASGLNGQSFAFHGYLPIHIAERQKKIKWMEKNSLQAKQTQIFMETPYRNNSLLQDLVSTCQQDTLLCIAVNITSDEEMIRTQTIKKWKKELPDIHKKPAIFLLQANT